MIELPECYVLSSQINETLKGKTVRSAVAAAHPHAFASYTGDPEEYAGKLAGQTITAANPGTGYTCGGNIEIVMDRLLLVISTPIRFHAAGEKLPGKHQLLLEFEDGSHLTCTVQMWGAMLLLPVDGSGKLPEGYHINPAPTPMEDTFDRAYFDGLVEAASPKLSAKAFLATEQRIPGLGNGVLQDVLFRGGIHPKRKLQELSSGGFDAMYDSLKGTIPEMAAKGGRNTEKDLYGRWGGYQTVLSSKSWKNPCPACGGGITRQAYLGGNVYFCATCQPL